MMVRPVQDQDLPLLQKWLSEPENIKWLDFTETGLVKLKFMLSRSTDVYRVFAPSRSHPPIGIVAIVNIHQRHRNGVVWVILGNKTYAGQGYTAQACSELLQYAYQERKLNSVNSYVVESNYNPLIKVFGFHYYGRQRACHFVDGEFRDRLWYDLLSSEFRPLQYHQVETESDNARLEIAAR
jgi:RimJ/RimL family protein N-acetyltransferase